MTRRTRSSPPVPSRGSRREPPGDPQPRRRRHRPQRRAAAVPRAILVEDGLVVGFEPAQAERTIDAAGAIAVPGLIDSHAHVVFGDWTPRQSTIGWIESSLHGGVTMMMSASEVHLPGRPRDREGVKALALTAQRAYAEHRPGGVKVLGGSVIVEPVLEPEDFEQLAAAGVWLAKVGFGDFSPQADAAPLVRAAQANGFVVMNHTGGASIPDFSPVSITTPRPRLRHRRPRQRRPDRAPRRRSGGAVRGARGDPDCPGGQPALGPGDPRPRPRARRPLPPRPRHRHADRDRGDAARDARRSPS